MRSRFSHFPFSLAVAILLPFVTSVIQWEIWDFIQPLFFLLFYPTAFFAPLIGGLWAGIGATAISAVLAWYIFVPPMFSFSIEHPSTLISMPAYPVDADTH